MTSWDDLNRELDDATYEWMIARTARRDFMAGLSQSAGIPVVPAARREEAEQFLTRERVAWERLAVVRQRCWDGLGGE